MKASTQSTANNFAAAATRIPEADVEEIAREAMLAFAILLGGKKVADPETFYGFTPEQVSELHLEKQGEGDGLWFRLYDGRVFDLHGQPSQRGAEWYAPVTH